MKMNLFNEQVLNFVLSNIESCADRNAFYINGSFYTYKQFGEFISTIRNCLKKEYSENIYVGLVANDDIETYASIFATWLEGKCYVPLHPNQPIERLTEIINEIDLELILNSSDKLVFQKKAVLKTSELIYQKDLLSNDKEITDESLAYILFTSGSTGKPKGVTISRKNVAAFVDSFWDCGINVSDSDKCLQCFDLTFDVSVQSFLIPLLKGACAYTVPHDQIKYSYVSELLEEHQLTFGAVAPSMLRFLRPYFEEINLPAMKYCLLTAEAFSLDLVEEWATCIPNAKIYNFYGPTEATIYCTYCEFSRTTLNKTLNGMLSIGVPMKNVNVIITDENNDVLLPLQKGEVCVSGPQVFPGYWRSPEKDAKVFFEKEVSGKMNRYYHTGDLCYFDEDGMLMLYGRLDSQVKVHGYRVELGEIEFHCRKFLDGNNATVIVFQNKTGNNELALFVEDEKADKNKLVSYLNRNLPDYMIPTKIIMEKEFPLNANSKVDKIRLKEKLQLNTN